MFPSETLQTGGSAMAQSLGSDSNSPARILDFDSLRPAHPGRDGGPVFRDIVEKLPAAVYATDAAGRITFYNEAAAELWGCRPEIGKSEFCGSWKLFWPDGTPLPHDECPMALTLKHKRPVRGVEAVAERPDGARVPFMPYPTPVFDASGNLTGAVNMLVDLSDRKQSEYAAQRLAAIVESSDDAIVSKDLNGFIVSWNRGAEQLFGYLAEEVTDQHISILIPQERHDEEPAILDRIRHGERIDHYETVRRRKDGRLLDISLTVSPVRDGAGRIVGASKIARDITEKKQAEQYARMLARELEHRVKNVLTTVQSLTRLTQADTVPEFIRVLSGRFQALAQVQSLLASNRWNGANLRDIVAEELAAFRTGGEGQVRISGPPLNLGAQAAPAFAMVLHELATNAAKYGALSTPEGRVSIEWSAPARTFVLHWREADGPSVRLPEKTGFGSKLVGSMVQSLGGEIECEWAAQGLSCEIRVPADALLS
jgi:PAS domain S-box-containing protein